jgi:hypothetical protein
MSKPSVPVGVHQFSKPVFSWWLAPTKPSM